MKRRRERSKPMRVMRLWSWSEVAKAVPYLRSIVGSLREHWLDVGRRVDVYVVERGVSGEPDGPPQLVLRNAIVSSVDGDSGAFGGTSLEVGVALSLPQEQVPKVLDAQASGTLTLVDVPVATS